MWDRKELKARGKAAFRANYWKSVLAAVLLTIAVGTIGAAGGAAGAGRGSQVNFNINVKPAESVQEAVPDGAEGENNIDALLSVIGEDKEEIDIDLHELLETVPEDDRNTMLVAAAVMVIVVILIAVAVSLVMDILLLNPLEVSCQNFFLDNSQGRGELKSLERGFSPNWGNVVKTMFLRSLFIFLWSLLLVVPGLIKAYAYRMVPYILAENPDINSREARELSSRMMRGHKWRAFVLDLSFIGWYLLSVLTLGILMIFYVQPYKAATDAELYQALKEELALPETMA